MKKNLVILVIVIIAIMSIGAILFINTSKIKINEIQKLDSSRTIITYSILGGLENPVCVLNVKRGNDEKIEFPLSCPGAISPKGSHICNAQSQSAIIGDNELEVWSTIIDLSNANNIEVCCLNSESPINSPENLDLTKKDFICSSPYTIE